MQCDVCNTAVPDGEGHRVAPAAFRHLLDAGFGIDQISIEMLTSAGMPREQAVAMLREQYLTSTSDWLLCTKCARDAKNALRQDTKFNLDGGHFEVREFPKKLDDCEGLVPIPVIIDLIVGEEIGLYWIDRTPFVEELAAIRPFRLLLKSGLYRSHSGPLMWLLFYVPNPEASPQPFASMECHINPADPQHIDTWRRLANQTHWHLTLLGADNEVDDFFEFENDFDLDVALEAMLETCRGMRVTDFMSAKNEFWNSYTMDDLYKME